MSTEDQPLLRWTLSRKIGSLSAIFIFFTIIILISTVIMLKGLDKELKEIAELDTPLIALSTATEISQLEQHIIMEQSLVLVYSPSDKYLAKKNELIKKYKKFNHAMNSQIASGIQLVGRGFKSESRNEFKEIHKAFIQLRKNHKDFDGKFQHMISLLKSNKYPTNQTIEDLKSRDEALDQRAITLVNEIEDFTKKRSIIGVKHEQALFVVNVSITVATILLGILLSTIIITGIKSNIFRLSKGIKEVTLAITEDKPIVTDDIKINSTDELSVLADDLLKMVYTVSEDRLKKDLQTKSAHKEAEGQRQENVVLFKLNNEVKEQRNEIAGQMSKLQKLLDNYKSLNRVMSHDLANPISSIYGVLFFAGKDITELEKMKNIILNSVNSCRQIIDLVRRMSALDEGKIEIELETYTLKDMIDESIQMLVQRLKSKKIVIETDINPALEALVEKVSFVNSVMNNLLTNAIKFSEPNSKIIISAHDDKGVVNLSIRDFGIGMSETLVNNIFNINTPTSRTGTEGEPGTGFGMPLVEKYVNIYGGKIRISSKEKSDLETDHGTEINISLKKQLSYTM